MFVLCCQFLTQHTVSKLLKCSLHCITLSVPFLIHFGGSSFLAIQFLVKCDVSTLFIFHCLRAPTGWILMTCVCVLCWQAPGETPSSQRAWWRWSWLGGGVMCVVRAGTWAVARSPVECWGSLQQSSLMSQCTGESNHHHQNINKTETNHIIPSPIKTSNSHPHGFKSIRFV